MKTYMTMLGIMAMTMSAPAMAINLEYMVNPPEERSVSDIREDLTKARSSQNKKRIAVLERELAEKLNELEPAAGLTSDRYDHVLGH